MYAWAKWKWPRVIKIIKKETTTLFYSSGTIAWTMYESTVFTEPELQKAFCVNFKYLSASSWILALRLLLSQIKAEEGQSNHMLYFIRASGNITKELPQKWKDHELKNYLMPTPVQSCQLGLLKKGKKDREPRRSFYLKIATWMRN